jgi:hypothetical protein
MSVHLLKVAAFILVHHVYQNHSLPQEYQKLPKVSLLDYVPVAVLCSGPNRYHVANGC